MKIGIIIETKEFEKAWNAFRFTVAANKQQHETTMVDCLNMVIWADKVVTF